MSTQPLQVRWRRYVNSCEVDKHEWSAAMALAEFMDEHGRCRPSLTTLARVMRCARSTVVRALDGLEAKGLLERQRGGGERHPTRYVACFLDSSQRALSRNPDGTPRDQDSSHGDRDSSQRVHEGYKKSTSRERAESSDAQASEVQSTEVESSEAHHTKSSEAVGSKRSSRLRPTFTCLVCNKPYTPALKKADQDAHRWKFCVDCARAKGMV